ncbi:phage tail protein [Streptomyces scabiei]|uniref:phage tail protein n=1 Tax=Streptomyces scabiei TaxID=1930 RepID=UPI0038F60C4B
MSEDALKRLKARVPSHLLAADAGADGVLHALLGAAASELAVLEDDLEDLYDAWFIETCAEWVVPYIADLVGVAEVPPPLGPGTSRRAMVANTVAYRRRKGTPGVLEQVARDVTGWPARVVEFHRLLATSTHLNHVRLDRPATASLRAAARAELAGVDAAGASTLAAGLDPLPHTAEVRRIVSGRGRYGISALGVFLYPAQVQEIAHWSQARSSANGFTVDPFAWRTPLFAAPRPDGGIEHLAEEADLSVPLRPRWLLALLRAARSAGDDDGRNLPFQVRFAASGEELPPERIRVCGLEDLADTQQRQVMVDPVAGTFTCYEKKAPTKPKKVLVRYSYGVVANVGAGPYDRSAVHEAALAADGFEGTLPGTAAGQISVMSVSAPVSPYEVGTVAEALRAAEAAWDDGSARGGTYIVSIGDNASYPESTSVTVPTATGLVLVAAHWPRPRSPLGESLAPVPGAYTPEGLRPHLLGSLSVTAGAGSALLVDGIALDGDLIVESGGLGSLTVAQSTISGRIIVQGDNPDLQIRVVRSILSGVELNGPVPFLAVTDSALDGHTPTSLPRTRARRAAPAAATSTTVSGAMVHASFEGSTVRGDVTVRSLDASSSVLDGTVTAEHRQTGCLRFSYAAPGSRTPRRYHCAPEGTGDPVYASVYPGSPVHLALADTCPEAVRTGGEGGAEMGVHHHLRRPLRVAAARRALAPYLPVQIDLGIFGS